MVVAVMAAIVALLVAAPMVLGQGQGRGAGAPEDVDDTPFPIPAGSVFGNCAFDLTGQYSGAGKEIVLPDGSSIATGPGLKITLTNPATGTSETFSITGSFYETTDPVTGNVTTTSRGRSLLGDPVAGFVIVSGNYSFTLDENGNLVTPLSGEGKVIDVCEALA
jgi:hypothetical protein